MIEVIIEMGIVDGVYVDMAMGLGEWLPEKGIMLLGVGSMDGVEVF